LKEAAVTFEIYHVDIRIEKLRRTTSTVTRVRK